MYSVHVYYGAFASTLDCLVFGVKTCLQQLKVSEEQLHFYSGHVAVTVLIKL